MDVDLDLQTEGSQGKLGSLGAQLGCSSDAMENLSGTEVGRFLEACCSCPVRDRLNMYQWICIRICCVLGFVLGARHIELTSHREAVRETAGW